MTYLNTNGPTYATSVGVIVTLINSYVIPLLFALAFLFIVFNLVRYFFLEGQSEEGREKGKQAALYGLIGLAVLFSVWGLVNFTLSIIKSLANV
jgi:heme/copper-type cytochrome/quinol oxidase subunit 4